MADIIKFPQDQCRPSFRQAARQRESLINLAAFIGAGIFESPVWFHCCRDLKMDTISVTKGQKCPYCGAEE